MRTETAIRWIAIFALLAAPVSAAPLLPVTNPPTSPLAPYSGPTGDPHASMGQWFTDPRVDNAVTVRTHELHDNPNLPGTVPTGGGSAGSAAISGYITNVQYLGANITAFDVVATITNDTPALSAWLPGGNLLGETLIASQSAGPMLDTVLAVEFAVASLGLVPPSPTGAYQDPPLPYIIAANEDLRAWYGWNPNRPGFVQPGEPDGIYYVPAWDFGDIAPGASAARTLSFIIDGGMGPADPRYSLIASGDPQDMLFNRSRSLKIGGWLADLRLDDGSIDGGMPGFGSNAAVFANLPEPSALLMLAPVAVLATRRRSLRRRVRC